MPQSGNHLHVSLTARADGVRRVFLSECPLCASCTPLEGVHELIEIEVTLFRKLKLRKSCVILPGGGVALLRAVEALKRLQTENEDQKHGVEIVRKALQTAARQIAINAGDDGSIVVGKILEKDEYNFGYDAQTGEYGNLVSKGIIDPTKVVRCALQDAASVAGLLITTEAMVAEVPKKEPATPAMPGGGMGGMDY